jgi:hypothetical protein
LSHSSTNPKELILLEHARKRLSYANVMSSLAVFLVLGGGAAFAAGHLAKNSVGPKQLKKNAVTARNIKKNAVNGAKVKDASLTGRDIVASTLGTVPNANRAASAGHADTAGDSNTLQGNGPGAFARANQIESGSGDNTASSQTPLISFPDIGLEVRTDGDADATNELRFVNSRGTGNFLYWSTGSPNSVGTLGAGANFEVQGPVGAPLNHDVVLALQSGPNSFEPSPVISVTCRFSVPPTVACIGIRSL